MPRVTGSRRGGVASSLCAERLGSDYGPRVGVGWGRQTACPGVPSLWPGQGEGTRQRQFSTWISSYEEQGVWARGMFHSGLESPGAFFDLTARPIHARGELREGLTRMELLLALGMPGKRVVGHGWPGPAPL